MFRIFDPADMPGGTIDIPTWAQVYGHFRAHAVAANVSYLQDIRGYCGSLAHKCNHSFTPNGQFVVFDHPKFGLIPCVSTIADIGQDEEVSAQCYL